MSGVCRNDGCVQDETLGSGPTQTLVWFHEEYHYRTITESSSPTTIDESGSPTAHLPAYIDKQPVSTDIEDSFLCAPVSLSVKVSTWLSMWDERSEPPDEEPSAAQGFQRQALSHPEIDHSHEPLSYFPSGSGNSSSHHGDQLPVALDSVSLQCGQRKQKQASSEISEEERLLLDLKKEEKSYLSPLSESAMRKLNGEKSSSTPRQLTTHVPRKASSL